VFSSLTILKNSRFWFIILYNGTKRHVIFFGKKVVILYFRFWPKEAKKSKKASRGPHEGNKFCISDGTKHNPKNFGILYSELLAHGRPTREARPDAGPFTRRHPETRPPLLKKQTHPPQLHVG
jgi:hypothetical protein